MRSHVTPPLYTVRPCQEFMPKYDEVMRRQKLALVLSYVPLALALLEFVVYSSHYACQRNAGCPEGLSHLLFSIGWWATPLFLMPASATYLAGLLLRQDLQHSARLRLHIGLALVVAASFVLPIVFPLFTLFPISIDGSG